LRVAVAAAAVPAVVVAPEFKIQGSVFKLPGSRFRVEKLLLLLLLLLLGLGCRLEHLGFRV